MPYGFGVIPTDTVLIDGKQYRTADGVVIRRRIFAEQEAQQSFSSEDSDGVSYGDLNPVVKTFVIEDFSEGSGVYVDHGKKFVRKAWNSTLEHSHEGLLVLGKRRQAAGTLPHVNDFVHYRNEIYALTNGGLYEFDYSVHGWTLISTVTPYYHACIHNEWLVLAGGTATFITRFNGTAFSVLGGHTARFVESLDG